MILDVIHKQVSADFVGKLGFPWWFAPSLGLYKLTQFALNWIAGGTYAPIAQLMMSFQLGGACFTHAIAEGKGFGIAAHVPAIVFFSTTIGIQWLAGALPLVVIVPLHSALLGLGGVAGYVVVSLGAGGLDAAEKLPHSPVKWARHGVFGRDKKME